MTRDVLAYTIDTLRYEAEKIGCSPIEINGEADHIHLLLRFPPDLSAAKAVCLLKSRSSGAVLKRFPFLRTYSASGSFGQPLILPHRLEVSPLKPWKNMYAIKENQTPFIPVLSDEVSQQLS